MSTKIIIKRIFLAPFYTIFVTASGIKNFLYNKKIIPSITFPIPIICVGNLTMGGSGKTPLIEYLIHFLYSKNIYPCILSRGYGRKTSGFRIASHEDSSTTIGDEPFLIFQKYFSKICLYVSENRVLGIKKILTIHKSPVVLMDDGYQHRSLNPHFKILLTTFEKPFFKDYIFPLGMLRESRHNAQRTNIVIITKCPPVISTSQKIYFTKNIEKYTKKDTPIFFSTLLYNSPIPFGKEKNSTNDIILITGIANTTPLIQKLQEEKKNIIQHFSFPDHHLYTEKNLQEIFSFWKKNKNTTLFTTEKDFVKLNSPLFQEQITQMPIFYIPIHIKIIENETEFQKQILTACNKSEPFS